RRLRQSCPDAVKLEFVNMPTTCGLSDLKGADVMSPQDSQMLNDFLAQLIQARGIQKDPEADALIQRAVAQQPDATYLLVQRALLMEQALNNAKDQIAQ